MCEKVSEKRRVTQPQRLLSCSSVGGRGTHLCDGVRRTREEWSASEVGRGQPGVLRAGSAAAAARAGRGLRWD